MSAPRDGSLLFGDNVAADEGNNSVFEDIEGDESGGTVREATENVDKEEEGEVEDAAVSGTTIPDPFIQQANPSSTASARMLFRLPLPNPGSVGAPNFQGDNVSFFIDHFDHMVYNHGLTAEEAKRSVPAYSNFWLQDEIRGLPEFNDPAKSYSDFRDALKSHFEPWDSLTYLSTTDFLDSLINNAVYRRMVGRPMSPLEEDSLLRRFNSVGSQLIRDKKTTDYDLVRQLIRIYSEKLGSHYLVKFGQNMMDPGKVKLSELVKGLLELNAEKTMWGKW